LTAAGDVLGSVEEYNDAFIEFSCRDEAIRAVKEKKGFHMFRSKVKLVPSTHEEMEKRRGNKNFDTFHETVPEASIAHEKARPAMGTEAALPAHLDGTASCPAGFGKKPNGKTPRAEPSEEFMRFLSGESLKAHPGSPQNLSFVSDAMVVTAVAKWQEKLHKMATRIQALQRGKDARKKFHKIHVENKGEKEKEQDLKYARHYEHKLASVWELLTMHAGKTSAHLFVKDMVDIFHICKRGGIGPDLPHLVPQHKVGLWEAAEDLCPGEVMEICKMLIADPHVSSDDIMMRLYEVRQEYRAMDYKDLHVDEDISINLRRFRRLIELLMEYMCIDSEHLLTMFVWAKTGNFEFTEAMGTLLLEVLFKKKATGKENIFDQAISMNDFIRSAFEHGLIDMEERVGLPSAKISLLFQRVATHMPDLLKAREARRAELRGVKKKKKKAAAATKHGDPAAPEPKRGTSISGRVELSVMWEEVAREMPGGLYFGPMMLALHVLSQAHFGATQTEKAVMTMPVGRMRRPSHS